MTYHPAFTPEEWERAPQYHGPGNNRDLHDCLDTTILDFGALMEIAGQLSTQHAFEMDDRGMARGITRAPVMLGNTPGAFYKIVSRDFDPSAIHIPEGEEVLVVLEGILSVIDDRRFWYGREDADFAVLPGQVAKLRAGTMNRMRALGLFEAPESLALTVYQKQPDLGALLISTKGAALRAKQVAAEGTNLPYTPKRNEDGPSQQL